MLYELPLQTRAVAEMLSALAFFNDYSDYNARPACYIFLHRYPKYICLIIHAHSKRGRQNYHYKNLGNFRNISKSYTIYNNSGIQFLITAQFSITFSTNHLSLLNDDKYVESIIQI